MLKQYTIVSDKSQHTHKQEYKEKLYIWLKCTHTQKKHILFSMVIRWLDGMRRLYIGSLKKC